MKTIEFRLIKECTVFGIGINEFVKRPFSNGYNAFNLDTGEPCFVCGNTLCVLKET